MQKLSKVLDATPFTSGTALSKNNSSNTPPPGSMADAGTTNIQLAPRTKPLSEAEHTAIASSLLQSPCEIFTETKKIYGRKQLTDESGQPYFAEGQVIGEEQTTDITLSLNPNIKKSWLESALRPAPIHGITGALTHLMLHKRLGSNDQDRKILLRDYVEAMRGYPEFVVWLVCKTFWQDNTSNFFPKIAELRKCCDAIEQKLRRECGQALSIEQKPKEPPRKREEESDRGREDRRKLCDFFVNRGEVDYFDQHRTYSNYQLECRASAKYGWRLGDPMPPPISSGATGDF